MSINLVTYANQTVTPTNDAIIYENAIDQNGIFYGCNVTVSGNNVNITGGYGIVCGREFVIESESIAVTLAPSVPLDGRLYVRLDLADADNPIQLLTAQGATLPALEQDADVNYVNGAWEMELATFTVGVSALSDVVMTYETITGSKHTVPSPIADYVIEQGTSNEWRYRKWNSGKYECWQIKTGNYAINTSSSAYGGYRSASIAIPTFPITFIVPPTVIATSYGGNSLGAWVNHVEPTTTGGTFYFSAGAALAAADRSVAFYVYGAWK